MMSRRAFVVRAARAGEQVFFSPQGELLAALHATPEVFFDEGEAREVAELARQKYAVRFDVVRVELPSRAPEMRISRSETEELSVTPGGIRWRRTVNASLHRARSI